MNGQGAWWRLAKALGVVTGLSLAIACGARVDLKTGSETNWLSHCSGDSACPEEQTCLCGVCTTGCLSSSVCAQPHSTCLQGDGRTFEAPCSERPPLEAGICLPVCSGDPECGEGYRCSAGACIPVVALAPPPKLAAGQTCAANSECKSDVCLERVCVDVDLSSCESSTSRYEFSLLSEASDFDETTNLRNRGPVYFYINNDGTNPLRELTQEEIEQQGLTRQPCNCSPDVGSAEGAPGAGDIRPQSGGAPSLSESSLCQASPGSLNMWTAEPGFSDWGAAFGGSFEGEDAEEVRNASAWEGIAFWARRTSTFPVEVFVALVDQYTISSGGYCYDFVESELCDPFGSSVQFDEEWQLILLPFSDMQQRGLGVRSPLEGPELDSLVGFVLYLPSGVWNVRIDELAFYRQR